MSKQKQLNLILLGAPGAGKCDRCGGELYQRADDTEETARKRLDVYFAQTAPLIKYYTEAGKLVEIDGENSVDKVGSALMAAIQSKAKK